MTRVHPTCLGCGLSFGQHDPDDPERLRPVATLYTEGRPMIGWLRYRKGRRQSVALLEQATAARPRVVADYWVVFDGHVDQHADAA